MFRVSIVELGVTCLFVALAFIVPMIVSRGYARLNKRIQDLENKLAKKK